MQQPTSKQPSPTSPTKHLPTTTNNPTAMPTWADRVTGKAEKIQNLLEEMPNGDDSDFGELSDSDDEYLRDIGKKAMADPTVQENSDDISEDEEKVTDMNSGTGRHCLQLKVKYTNLRHFQASVAEGLIAAGKRPVGRLSLSQQQATKKRKAAVKPPESNVHLDVVSHMPIWSSSRLRCKSCPWQKHSFSFVYCVKCEVHLCFNKDRNCFATYH
ncbi:hypothetical protein MRX96_026102 [Rhipicephalus microplus]